MSQIKDIVKFIDEHSPKKYSLVLLFPILTLIAGFIIWSIYLYSLGFIINDLLRARFILTGALFVLATVVVYFFAKFILSKIKVNSRVFYCLLFLLWLLVYAIILFPRMPFVIGGGQPKAISLITDEAGIKLLTSFGFRLAEGAKYQTESVCLVYDGIESLIILDKNRLILLEKSLIKGFVSLPGVNATVEQVCIPEAAGWALKGFWSSTILSVSITYNSFATPFGLPSMRFSIP